VQITDWLPTFAAVTGFKPAGDPKWDGTDLLSLITRHEPPAERPIYTVAPGWRSRALRVGDWKLIVSGQGEKTVHELYNLATDPAEKDNLAATRSDRLRDLLARLTAVSARDRDSVAKD